MSRRPELGYFDEGIDLTAPESYRSAGGALGTAAILPLVAYRSLAFAHLEDERIWTRDWICAGTRQDVEVPGDLLPYTVGFHGIHVRRQEDGVLTGSFNQAQHGGCRVVPVQCQGGTKTSCSFTSCGYSRDRGPILCEELEQSTAAKHQYLGMRPERLFPIRVATVGNLILVNLDEGSSACGPFRGPFSETLREEGYRVGVRWVEYECNWKFLAQYLLAMDSVENTCDESAVLYGRSGDVAVAWRFPNLLLFQHGNSYCVVLLQPTALAKTLCRIQCFERGKSVDSGANNGLERWSEMFDGRGREGELFAAGLEGPNSTASTAGSARVELPLQRDRAGLWGQNRLIERITVQAQSNHDLRLFGSVRNYLL